MKIIIWKLASTVMQKNCLYNLLNLSVITFVAFVFLNLERLLHNCSPFLTKNLTVAWANFISFRSFVEGTICQISKINHKDRKAFTLATWFCSSCQLQLSVSHPKLSSNNQNDVESNLCISKHICI